MAEQRKKTAVKSGARSAAKPNGAAGKPRSSAKSQSAKGPASKSSAKVAARKSPARSAAPPKKQPVSKAAASKTSKTAKRPAAKKSVAAPPASSKPGKSITNDVLKVIEQALDDMKAQNVRVLDVRKLTDVADMLVIASGNSDRHVRSIADRVVQDAKKAGFRPVGVEGERDGEWVLVDLQDIIVHIMLPRIREFYRLENLWDVSAARREAAEIAAAAQG